MTWIQHLRRKRERMKHALRGSVVHRLLGDRLFSRHVWKFSKESVAKGLALGLFVAFTPTIPFQMLFCSVLAVMLRVNLPVALAACWITNPVTALPIYWAAHRVGKIALNQSGLWDILRPLFSLETRAATLMVQSLNIWTGALIFSTVSAVLGYLAVRILWRYTRQVKEKIKASRHGGRTAAAPDSPPGRDPFEPAPDEEDCESDAD